MIKMGQIFGQQLQLPAVFELIGDVGVGKTTFTKGLAQGLGVSDDITSPSFTLSKRYNFTRSDDVNGELVHYDFYRLAEPGIMREELAETLAEPKHVTVIEWGGDVAQLLPSSKYQLKIDLCEDGSREITLNSTAKPVENLWKTFSSLWKTNQKTVEKLWLCISILLLRFVSCA